MALAYYQSFREEIDELIRRGVRSEAELHSRYPFHRHVRRSGCGWRHVSPYACCSTPTCRAIVSFASLTRAGVRGPPPGGEHTRCVAAV